jgi:hypothetical protein
MKIHHWCFLSIIVIMGCINRVPENELPSQELKDTLIKESLLQSSLPLLQDTITNKEVPREFYYVNEEIQCYSIRNEIKSPVVHTVNEFSFDYILSFRFTSNGQKAFFPQDTNYFKFQISTCKQYRLPCFSNYPIKLIDKKEINKQVLLNMDSQKSHKFFRYNFVNIYMPMLNKERNIAIVGIEERGYSEQVNSVNGDFYVLKKVGKKWVVTNTVPWKDN